MLDQPTASSSLVYLVKLSCTMFKEDPFMKATSSELLMRNFNEIFIELDPTQACGIARGVLHRRLPLDSSRRSHCGPRGYQ